MTRDWRDFLGDLVRYAELAADLVADKADPELLAANSTRRLALERALEIVGEAAARIPPEVRARYGDLPWQAMIGTRNRLAHGYFALDHELLWRTARESIPALLPALREVARVEGADPPPPLS